MLPTITLRPFAISCLTLIIASLSAVAQPVRQTVREVFHFTVSEIISSNGKHLTVKAAAGAAHGLFVGAKGEALGVSSKTFPNRGAARLGTAEVLELEDSSATVTIMLVDTTAPEKIIMAGDMVALPASVPKMDYRSIFYDLAQLNITFTTNLSEPLFNYFEVVANDSLALEQRIFKAMAADIHETAGTIMEMTDDNPSWLEPMTGGRFKGISMITAMEQTSPADVVAFLRFVKSYPGKYMGKIWRIDETYATWLINDTPIGQDDLRELLLSVKSNAELGRTVEEYKDDIADGGFLDIWNETAEEWGTSGKIDSAEKLNALTVKVAWMLNDSSTLAWSYFTRGRIADAAENYEAAIDHYEQARTLFTRLGDTKGADACANNMATMLNSLSRYEQALAMFDTAYQLKSRRLASDSSGAAHSSMGHTLAGRGLCLMNLGKFKEALAAYQEAYSHYAQSNSLDDARNQVWAMVRIAKTLNRLGEYTRAIEQLTRALGDYRNLADRFGEADALDEIGYQYSKLNRYQESIDSYEQAYRIHLDLGDKKNAGFSRSNVGQSYWSLGKYEQAIAAHREAIALREEANDRSGQAYSWSQLGALYQQSGDPHSALDAYNRAQSIQDALGDRAEVARTLGEIGNVYYKEKSYADALERFRRSLEIREAINARADIAATLYSIGNVYYADHKYGLAKENYTRSLAIQKEIGDRSGELYTLTSLGLIAHYSDHEHDAAEGYYRQALAIADSINSRSDLAYCHLGLGNLYSLTGSNSSALKEFTTTLAIYREIGEKNGEASTLLRIGDLSVQRGEFDDAMEKFRESQTISTASNNRGGIANALISIGDVQRLLGQFDLARQTAEQSLAINREVDNPWGVSSALGSIANIYNAQGDYQKAIRYYDLSDSIYKAIGEEISRATPINNSGTLYFFQGDYDHALANFHRTLALLDSVHEEDEFRVIVTSNIGEVYFEQKKYAEAETWLLKALTLSEKLGTTRSTASVERILGKVKLAQEAYPEAKRYLLKAQEIITRTGELDALADIDGVIGELYYRLKSLDEAERVLDTAVAISKRIGTKKYLWEPLYTLGLIHRDRGDKARSIAMLKESIDAIEELRNKVVGGEKARKLFSSGNLKIRIYEALIGLLIEQGETDRALEYLQRSNSDDLRQRFGAMGKGITDPKYKEVLEQERALKAQVDNLAEQISMATALPPSEQKPEKIASLKNVISVAEGEYARFVDENIRKQPDLRNRLSGSINPKDLRAGKQDIPSDVAVVVYLLGETKLFIFVATADTVVAKVVPAVRTEVEGKLRRFYTLLSDPKGAASRSASTTGEEIATTDRQLNEKEDRSVARIREELHQLLIAPIQAEIQGKKKLAITPSGELYFLPFQSLTYTLDNGSRRQLIDDYTIFYINDLRLFLKKPDLSAPLKIMAFGNADGTLPNAEGEAEDICRIYPGSTAFIRSQATKDRIKNISADYNVVHFATHGNLDYQNPENFYLTMAKTMAPQDDGRLTVEDIGGITNLQYCRLITLSACNTAVTDQSIEGWPINPATAFLEGGAASVVASLWQVDDEATALLMHDFYTDLPRLGAAESLRHAQMKLAENPRFASPFYWAPFVLFGNWR